MSQLGGSSGGGGGGSSSSMGQLSGIASGGMGGAMGGGGGGADVIADGSGILMTTDTKLAAINSDTDQILTHVNNIDNNIANMNSVLMAKQQLIVQVAQMNVLASQGKVLQTDPLSSGNGLNSVADSVIPALTNDASQNIGSTAGYQQYSSAGPLGAVANQTVGANPMNAINSLISGSAAGMLKSGNLGQSSIMGLVTQAISTAGSSVFDMSYSGATGGFKGLNANNIDNILGHNGQVISMDRQVPQALYPVTAAMKNQLSSLGVRLAGISTSKGMLVADGVYIRTEAPYDGAYVSMVEKGSGVDSMQFFSAVSDGDLSTYSALSGNASDGYGFRPAVNMNDSLSGGAFGAVSRYNARVGGGVNPYATFAQTIAPVLPNVVSSQPAAEHLFISPADVRASRAAPPVNLAHFGSVASVRTPAEMARLAAFTPFAPPLSKAVTVSSTGSSDEVIVFGPTKQQAGVLMTKVTASDSRLKQNSSMVVMNRLMLSYSKNVLTATTNLRNQLQQMVSMNYHVSPDALDRLASGKSERDDYRNVDNPLGQLGGTAAILSSVNGSSPGSGMTGAAGQALNALNGSGGGGSSKMSANNAIESVVMIMQNCDNMTLVLQQQISNYASEVEHLLKDRDDELKSRAQIVSDATTANTASIPGRVMTLLDTAH